MPDTDSEPGDRRWRSWETLQRIFDDMDQFRRSPEGQRLQAEREGEVDRHLPGQVLRPANSSTCETRRMQRRPRTRSLLPL